MQPSTAPNPKGRPLVFGEVLFDHFLDDDARVLGGAPFNVAWHLQGFGLRPMFISRIGQDDEGRRVTEAMRDWGMDTRGIQRDAYRPTGRVEIRLEKGQPSFDILPDQAYDHIDFEPAELLVREEPGALLYHGTLAARSPRSRQTIEEIHRRARLPTFLDVNLRAPWWTAHSVRLLLRDRQWVKLNDEELAAITGEPVGPDTLESQAAGVRERFGIGHLIVTLGADGALIAHEGTTVRGEPASVADLKDTVGAGDAFSAVAILGATKGWDLADTLQRAMAFAGAVCGIRGATTTDQSLYNRFLDQWGA